MIIKSEEGVPHLILGQWATSGDAAALLAPRAVVRRPSVVCEMQVLGPHPGQLLGLLHLDGQSSIGQIICGNRKINISVGGI